MKAMARRIVLSSSRLNALITAIGVSLLLQNGGLKVFGANPKFVPNVVPEKTLTLFSTPMSSPLDDLGGKFELQIQTNSIVIFLVGLLLMAMLRHIVLYTQRGKRCGRSHMTSKRRN